MRLTVKQTRAIEFLEDSTTTELYYGGAAGGGKSYFGSYWIIKSALKYPGTRWLIGRSELKNLKKTTLNSFFEVCKEQGLKANEHYRFNQQDSIISLPNGSQIILADLFAYPSDPEFDSLGSLEITGAFIDEAPQVSEKGKHIVKSRIRYKIDEFGLIPKLLMCGNPSKNWAYYEFYQPAMNGLLKPDRQFIQALVTDNPYISPHYIESLKGLDKNSRSRLLDGNWNYDDDPAALIDYDKILDCFTNDFEHLKGEKYITSDLARLGGDRIIKISWDGWRAKVGWWRKERLNVSGGKIEESRLKLGIPKSNVLCDDDGLGGGVVDYEGYQGFVNNSRPLPNPLKPNEDENYGSLKDQCYYRLADRINKGGLYIEFDDDCDPVEVKALIIQELEQVKQHDMDKDGKKKVMPKIKIKELIGRSPDFADTLMMREWFDLKPKFEVLAW